MYVTLIPLVGAHALPLLIDLVALAALFLNPFL